MNLAIGLTLCGTFLACAGYLLLYAKIKEVENKKLKRYLARQQALRNS